MYIKSVVLDGFKSYGQRTEIHGFDPEFNAITGLNGSGKSNILDSICFVLGISNLSQVRASSLQDLIYKSGQAGVSKATVSITFDNRNRAQCPPGFEEFDEITVTRQVVMGGKNKYMINGSLVQNKRVQDLFCSVQLNVNNPHFLIMQGKITKVLNMKPPEILAMIEEAAGTRMYEMKRQVTQKTLDKKNAKLAELESIFDEEVSPKLEKLREERAQFFEYQRLERELEHMTALFQAWQYYAVQKDFAESEQALKDGEAKVQAIHDTIKANKQRAAEIDAEVANLSKEAEMAAGGKIKQVESTLKEKALLEAQANAAENGSKENIAREENKMKQLTKNFKDDEAALKAKEQELTKVQELFQTLKGNDEADSEAFAASQRKYEAVSVGMDINEAGEAETLQEQLMGARQEAVQAGTEFKEANMQLEHCRTQLTEKQKYLGSNASDYVKDKANLEAAEKEVASLEKSLNKLNYSDARMTELQERRHTLRNDIRQLRDRIENFEASKPYTRCHYKDPEPNFNRQNVHGVVCRLTKLKDRIYGTALETAAGGKLYNVIVDSDITSKMLLQRGNLQQRTTFIPLNKIQGGKIDNNTIKLAQNLVGKENVQPALSLIDYNKTLQPAMEYIFGNVFICKDMNAAKQVTFHDRIRRRCVTLEGDVTDPSGTLSGGARQKTTPILLQLEEIQQYEQQLKEKEQELAKIEAEIRSMSASQEQWANMTQRLEFRKHELDIVRRRLQQTTHHQQQEEVNKLKETVAELTEKLKTCKDVEKKANLKAKELENKMKDSKGHRERQLKEAEMEMKRLKQKSDKSRKEWKQREQDFETLNLEISELKKGLENIQEQLTKSEQNLEQLKQQYEESQIVTSEIKEIVANLQKELKAEKSTLTARNGEIQKKVQKKESLLEQNSELELEIKKQQHDIKRLEDDYKIWKSKVAELTKKCRNDERNLKDAEGMSDKDGHDLERRIRNATDRRQKLGRVVNPKAQSMYEQEEKLFNQIQKRISLVITDKKKLLQTIADLDRKKKEAIQLAYSQVTKDFGSIFATLLPGSDAKLKVPDGYTVLDGLEVKVSLGGVWKESLSELSGGQRSLAALSLILAMLLFKPAPLYILDEVDAALDLSHTQNIGNMLKSHFKQSQFMIVSLKDGMFNNANVLFRTQFVDGMSVVSRTVNRSNR